MANPRLQRLAGAAVERAQLAAWALLALGCIAFVLLPLSGRRCYLDEKALLVGGALPTARQSGALDASLAAFQAALAPAAAGDFEGAVAAAAAAVAAAMPAAGTRLAFHRYAFNSSTGGAACATLHTVARSPRGDGSEGFVLAMTLDAGSPAAAAFAAGVGAATAVHLRQSGWLAKDAVLLFVDAACGASTLESTKAWTFAYNSAHELFDFPRAGLLQQALVLEVGGSGGGGSGGGIDSGASQSGAGAATAQLSVHGSDGQLPNLDLYYLIKRNVELHTPLAVTLRAAQQALPPLVRHAAAALGNAAAAAGMGQAATVAFASELATLAAFAAQQADGRPTGAHAPFLQQQVDAATLALQFPALEASLNGVPPAGAPAPALVVAAAHTLAAAELTLRTFNNLQERLHHSTALYALLSPDRFVSIASYLAPPGCLLAAAAAQLVAASQLTANAPHAACRAAWRRVAAVHAASLALGTVASSLLGVAPASSSGGGGGGGMQQLAQQLVLVLLGGLAGAEGPAALLAALAPDASGQPAVGSSGQVRACTHVVALAAAVLQGSALLLVQWVRCSAFLLAAVPLHALALRRPQLGAGRAAAVAPLLLAAGAAAWELCSGGGAAWLANLLLPNLLLCL